MPTQEAIDALGGGKTLADWHRRFDLAYEQCKDQAVTLVGGVCSTALAFGRYLRKTHGVYPKDLWQTQVMTLGSLVVSTPILPRYEIGDLILALKLPYFRCIGRMRWWTPLRYAWQEIVSLNLGQL